MSNKSFSAGNWLTQNSEKVVESSEHIIRSHRPTSLAPFLTQVFEQENAPHDIGKFFVPGWKGESLISKNIKTFSDTIDVVAKDVRTHIIKAEKFSKRLKVAIYDEFLTYAEFKAISFVGMDQYNDFWKELTDNDSEHAREISNFIDIFSFRTAVIYLFKVRFITTLHDKTNIDFDMKNIYSPNAFFTSIFKKQSSTELKAKCFEQNVFSWYRPCKTLEAKLLSFKNICHELKITEVIKTVSQKGEEIISGPTLYSHSLSHKNFGLYLNSIIINLPIWLESLKNKRNKIYTVPNESLEIISSKYAGDYLESMALSHWLAQEHNQEIQWEQIICPDFKSDEFTNGLYLKSINELQFLTFLAEIAKKQQDKPVSYICKVINSHLNNRKDSQSTQRTLLPDDNAFNNSTYDRIILNLNLFPKNNPQHFLFSKIQAEKKYLKEHGLIYVITSKKIFVPSQKAKVEGLLKDFKIEAVFNLEDVSGLGEVGSYVYVFSNRKMAFAPEDFNKKHVCLNFRYNARLHSFHQFERITHATNLFFSKNLGDMPPLFQQVDENLRMEFYQDAIVGGQLIHSHNKDSSNITHPGFFKKLMNLCNSLDYYFDLQQVDPNYSSQSKDHTFFDLTHDFERDLPSHIFIVDQREKHNIRIEIITINQLEAKAYDYGHARCSYFYAYKKWSDISFTSLNDFFCSSIGKQIINLTFNNELRKIKGNLNKLLLPKFYIQKERMPSHILEGLKLLSYSSEEILSLHPTAIEKSFYNLESFLPVTLKDYPSHTLELVSAFKRSLFKAIENLGDSSSIHINFTNPLLKSPLLMSKTFPIYPENQEVFIEFNSDAHHLIHANIEKVKLAQVDNGLCLQIFANNEIVLSLHSDEDMLYFLEFLFKETTGYPVSRVLQAITVPKLEDLKAIISSYKMLKDTLSKITDKLPPLYDQLLRSTIFIKS